MRHDDFEREGPPLGPGVHGGEGLAAVADWRDWGGAPALYCFNSEPIGGGHGSRSPGSTGRGSTPWLFPPASSLGVLWISLFLCVAFIVGLTLA
jgi:hypothetical protein